MKPGELSAWYWRGCAALLLYGVLWNPMGYCFAGILALAHLAHFLARERRLTAFPVQVRAAYLAVLTLAAWEPLRPLYLVPLVGTWALVLYGYCFLARVLSLAPWNRSASLDATQAWNILTAPPRANSAFDAFLAEPVCAGLECEGEPVR